MSQIHDNVEAELAELTQWPGGAPAPALWEKAAASQGLSVSGRAPRRAGVLARLGRPVSRWGALAAGVALVVTVIVLAGDRERGDRRAGSSSRLAPPAALNYGAPSVAAESPPALRVRPSLDAERGDRPEMRELELSSFVSPDSPRQIVHKASIDLMTNDVRGVFHKVIQLLSEAKGEFVQDSSLTGTGNEASGSITLRVTAARLSEVMQGLRELGVVQQERIGGEDVTSQVVDLDARLANERRIEAELLELIGSRKDAPLKEIMEARDALGSIRERIEKMTAEQQRLGKLVALATVLVSIRADPTPAKPPEPAAESPWSKAGKVFESAWARGVENLLHSGGWVLSFLIGNAFWILAVAAAFLAYRQSQRRNIARMSAAPASR